MERTRALECFLSERQEGEEKAIMKNLRLKEVSIKDLDQIRALFGQFSEIWSDPAVEKEYISK